MTSLANELLKIIFLDKEKMICDLINGSAADVNEIFRRTLEEALNQVLDVEFAQEFPKILESDTSDYRNGNYARKVMTQYGMLELRLSRDRHNQYQTRILSDYQRRMRHLDSLAMTLYSKGLSCSDIKEVLAETCGGTLSESSLAKIAGNLHDKAREFNERKLPECVFVYLDGTYFSYRRKGTEGGEIADSYQRECIEVATGITRDGKSVVLGFWIVPNEGAHSWSEALRELKDRGIGSPSLFITDGLQGMPEAIADVFPKAGHQRCLVHIQRNIYGKVRKKEQKEAMEDFRKVYTSDNKEDGEKHLTEFVAKWGKRYPSFVKFLDIKENILAFYRYPKCIRKLIYTSNSIENFNASVKRELRKRISLNSQRQSEICLAAISESYNCRLSARKVRGYWELTDEELAETGFNPRMKSDETM